MQAVSAGLYYTQELLTTFGLMRLLTRGPEQLSAELRGQTTFPDPRLPHLFVAYLHTFRTPGAGGLLHRDRRFLTRAPHQ